jgi:hypothetical protein
MIVRKQCDGCEYKQLLNAHVSHDEYCCHYLLETGRCRVIAQDGTCLSRKSKKRGRKKKKNQNWGYFGI